MSALETIYQHVMKSPYIVGFPTRIKSVEEVYPVVGKGLKIFSFSKQDAYDAALALNEQYTRNSRGGDSQISQLEDEITRLKKRNGELRLEVLELRLALERQQRETA